MKVSVIIPSKGCEYLRYTLRALAVQSFKPYEVIVVAKNCYLDVERLCARLGLRALIIEQKKGYFTTALNLGKKEATGDLLIFTDDDAIPTDGWIKRYVKLYKRYPTYAGICSRDIYLDLHYRRLLPTPDDMPYVKLYRCFLRSILDRCHPLLKRYRLGVYLTRDYRVAHGHFIPHRTCLSLPFRGVNLSFLAQYVPDIWFPEHPKIIRGLGCEQYFGLQIFLKGFDTIYTPDNPVLHIVRESLSRTKEKSSIREENIIMKKLYEDLLKRVPEQTTKVHTHYPLPDC